MKIPRFDTFPDASSIWIRAADRDLTQPEQENALDALGRFIDDWSSHGRKVLGQAAIVKRRFAVIVAHIPGGDVSGCGIDASVHALSGLSATCGFEWASALDVFYQVDGEVRQADRATFSSLAANGTVTPETIVFDTSLTTVADWREGRFAVPVHESWHGRVFRFAVENI